MTFLSTPRLPVALLVTLTVAACSNATRGPTRPSPQPAVRVLGDSAAVANAKPDSNRFPFTEADVHFMSGMIGHHAQAIAMSRLAPTHGASPSLSTLAARIINAQTDEITLMQQWLRDRRQTVPEPSPKGMKMVMNGEEHMMLMPGMLTDEQMKQLEDAKGKEFDQLFLTFMIQHHQGALAMVRELFATPGAGQDEATFKLASDVNADQETEIARMQKMLVALKFEGRLP
jgi:uncharacterized protein (DUF305 family)